MIHFDFLYPYACDKDCMEDILRTLPTQINDRNSEIIEKIQYFFHWCKSWKTLKERLSMM